MKLKLILHHQRTTHFFGIEIKRNRCLSEDLIFLLSRMCISSEPFFVFLKLKKKKNWKPVSRQKILYKLNIYWFNVRKPTDKSLSENTNSIFIYLQSTFVKLVIYFSIQVGLVYNHRCRKFISCRLFLWILQNGSDIQFSSDFVPGIQGKLKNVWLWILIFTKNVPLNIKPLQAFLFTICIFNNE